MSDSVREAFEKWWKEEACNTKEYMAVPRHDAFQGVWQAATAAADAEWRGVVEKLVEALEACESAFSKFAPQEESAYGTAWIKVRAVLSKAKGIA